MHWTCPISVHKFSIARFFCHLIFIFTWLNDSLQVVMAESAILKSEDGVVNLHVKGANLIVRFTCTLVL